MNIIDENLNELEKTGCFTANELEDLRVRFIKVYEDAFWEGREFSNNERVVTNYGKKEDW
jgi:hypothetical protein